MDHSQDARLQPLGEVCQERSRPPHREQRSSLVIEGEERDSVTTLVSGAEEVDGENETNDGREQNLKDLYMETKVEMLSIIKSEVELKLEMRAMKEEFLQLLLKYSEYAELECGSGDILDSVPARAKTPEPEDEPVPLEETVCHDSSTIVYSTDACYQDSSTVEETPTNRKMPRERYLMLNEDGSRAVADGFESPPTWVRGIRPLVDDPLLQSRRRSLMLAYPITMKDFEREIDDDAESGCFSRGPTYPGSDSMKSSADASPDFSMEVMKDSDNNQSELTTPSSDGIRSSDVTNTSLPGYNSIYMGLDESSYKESDAAWSPDGESFTSTNQRRQPIEDRSFELTLSRKKNNKRLLTERMTRQISGATCSSTSSDVRLPQAPMNSPNSTALSNEYMINDITGSSFSNLPTMSQCLESASSLALTTSRLQLPVLEEVLEENNVSDDFVHLNVPGVIEEPDNEPVELLLPDIDEEYDYNDINDVETVSLSSVSRPPCIGGEDTPQIITPPVVINLPPKAEKRQSKLSNKLAKTPLGKTFSAVRRSGSFSFRRSLKTHLENEAPLESSSVVSSGVDSMPDSKNTSSEPKDKELSQGQSVSDEVAPDDASSKKVPKSAKKSKRFPMLQRIQSLKKHFKGGLKGKTKDSD